MEKRYLENLSKLADFLETEVKDHQFDMEHYMLRENGLVAVCEEVPECGTVGCAIGWASSLFFNDAMDSMYWCDFSARVFGSSFFDDDLTWCFLFDADWAKSPKSSRKDTINRIRKFIRQGGVLTPYDVRTMEKYNIGGLSFERLL